MAVMDSSEEERRKNENERKGVTERLLAVDSEGKEKAETKTTMDRMTSGVNPAGKSTINSLLSIGVIIGVAASWACATQFRKSTMVIDPAHFYAPYAMVWFSTCFMLLCYPVFLIYAFFAGKNLSIEHTEALKVFRAKSPSGFHLFGAFLWRELLFLSLWTVINYAYAQSLGLISASAATSIMSANTAAVCVLGWAILREPFNAIKTLAVLLAIAGVVVVSLDSEFAGSPLGIGLCVASAACAALYKVLFKLFHGSTATLGQVSLFMSGLGLVNLTLNAIPMANLVHFGVDRIEWDHVPWLPLFGSAILGLVFNFLVNFGIVLLDPLVISIGMIFGIPLSAGIDLLFRSLTASPEFLCGSILVTISFFLIAFPVESILRKCCCHRNNLEEENVKLNRAIIRKDGN